MLSLATWSWLESKLRSIDFKLWNQVCLKIKCIESYFQFAKPLDWATLELNRERNFLEGKPRLVLFCADLGGTLLQYLPSRWQRAFVGRTQEGSAEESEQRTEREWNQSYCHHPVYGLCALWCRQVAHQTKNPSCLNISVLQWAERNLSITLPNPRLHV